MIRAHCQICGRPQKRDHAGAVVHHHYRGNVCLGAYSPPVEESFDAIPAAIDHWTQADNRHRAKFDADRVRRSNEPLPAAFWQSWAHAAKERSRLIARLRRLATRKPVSPDPQRVTGVSCHA